MAAGLGARFKEMNSYNRARFPALVAAALVLAGCSAEPKAISFGRDECAECKMTLVDRHYGAELITSKGKVFIFDDVNCLLVFQKRGDSKKPPRAVIVDFTRQGGFIPAEQAYFLKHDGLNSPMGADLAAFSSIAELESIRSQLGGGGSILRWSEVGQIP